MITTLRYTTSFQRLHRVYRVWDYSLDRWVKNADGSTLVFYTRQGVDQCVDALNRAGGR